MSTLPISCLQLPPQLLVFGPNNEGISEYLSDCFINNNQFKKQDLYWYHKKGDILLGEFASEHEVGRGFHGILNTKALFSSGLYENAPKRGGKGSNKGDGFLSWLEQESFDDLVQNSKGKLCARLKALEGSFSFAIPNKECTHILLATSALNPETLFYCSLKQFPDAYCISNDIRVLLTILKGKVCKTALSFWLAGRPDPNRSLYQNIQQVPQGGYVVLSKGNKPATDLFWDINAESAERYSAKSQNSHLLEDSKERLSYLLSESISHSLATQKGLGKNTVFAQLSGGMDSTSVYALANCLSALYDLEVQSVSHIYANTESADERSNIQAMISRYPQAQSHFIELDKYVDQRFKALYPTHPQSPGMVMSPKYHQEAQLLREYGAGGLLTGNGGDEMFWGHSLAYFDRFASGNWKVVAEVMQSARSLNLPVLGALRSVFLGPLKQVVKNGFNRKKVEDALASFTMPVWLTPKAISLIKEADKRNNPFSNSKNNLARYARYEGVFQTSTFNPMRSYQAVFNEYGLKVQHPLFNKHIAQFSFDVPQHMHISGAYPKLLLRNTMNSYLPHQVCWDNKKTVFDKHFAKLLKQNEDEIRVLLSHEGLADEGLIENDAVLTCFNNVMKSPHPSLQVDLLYAILVQSWYQAHIL